MISAHVIRSVCKSRKYRDLQSLRDVGKFSERLEIEYSNTEINNVAKAKMSLKKIGNYLLEVRKISISFLEKGFEHL